MRRREAGPGSENMAKMAAPMTATTGAINQLKQKMQSYRAENDELRAALDEMKRECLRKEEQRSQVR